MPGHAVAALAEEFVAPWRAIAADHIDFGARLAQNVGEVVEQVENLGIILVDIPGAVVAQKVIEPCERLRKIAVALTIDDVQLFARVRVKKS